MADSIIAAIDAEIKRLRQARALLAEVGTEPRVTRGRPKKTDSTEPISHAPKKRPPLSPEARERMRQGQIKRWAAKKKTAKGEASSVPAVKLKTSQRNIKSAKNTVPKRF